ncbi:hypothetical protein DFH06DRAFT_1305325 [Mycena polygramma]|nr:hypothetical protein DFH06DRAFT_1305325 [Mycena polygramma]
MAHCLVRPVGHATAKGKHTLPRFDLRKTKSRPGPDPNTPTEIGTIPVSLRAGFRKGSGTDGPARLEHRFERARNENSKGREGMGGGGQGWRGGGQGWRGGGGRGQWSRKILDALASTRGQVDQEPCSGTPPAWCPRRGGRSTVSCRLPLFAHMDSAVTSTRHRRDQRRLNQLLRPREEQEARRKPVEPVWKEGRSKYVAGEVRGQTSSLREAAKGVKGETETETERMGTQTGKVGRWGTECEATEGEEGMWTRRSVEAEKNCMPRDTDNERESEKEEGEEKPDSRMEKSRLWNETEKKTGESNEGVRQLSRTHSESRLYERRLSLPHSLGTRTTISAGSPVIIRDSAIPGSGPLAGDEHSHSSPPISQCSMPVAHRTGIPACRQPTQLLAPPSRYRYPDCALVLDSRGSTKVTTVTGIHSNACMRCVYAMHMPAKHIPHNVAFASTSIPNAIRRGQSLIPPNQDNPGLVPGATSSSDPPLSSKKMESWKKSRTAQ